MITMIFQSFINRLRITCCEHFNDCYDERQFDLSSRCLHSFRPKSATFYSRIFVLTFVLIGKFTAIDIIHSAQCARMCHSTPRLWFIWRNFRLFFIVVCFNEASGQRSSIFIKMRARKMNRSLWNRRIFIDYRMRIQSEQQIVKTIENER